MIDLDIEAFVRKYRTKRPESLLAEDLAKCSDEMHRCHPRILSAAEGRCPMRGFHFCFLFCERFG